MFHLTSLSCDIIIVLAPITSGVACWTKDMFCIGTKLQHTWRIATATQAWGVTKLL